MRGSAALNVVMVHRETDPQAAYLIEAEPRAARPEVCPLSASRKLIRTLTKSNYESVRNWDSAGEPIVPVRHGGRRGFEFFQRFLYGLRPLEEWIPPGAQHCAIALRPALIAKAYPRLTTSSVRGRRIYSSPAQSRPIAPF
jgi:hypothetical protein